MHADHEARTGRDSRPGVTSGGDLLERDAALAALHEYAVDAGNGSGRLVLISGEAGVGKTSLLEHFEEQLPDADWYWSGCDGLFTPAPLGPLFDLADQLRGDLAQLCRNGAPREQLFRALHQQASDATKLQVVVIEDIHWADEASLDLLRYLGRRMKGATLLLLTTYRDDALALDHPLRMMLGDVGTVAATRRIGVARLSRQAVGVLAAPGALDADELYELTGGNPFYVTEVLRDGLADHVPESARDVVLARAARLHRDTSAVLEVAALTGGRIDVRLLESVRPQRRSAVDELIAGGLLMDDGGGLRFRHEVARLAIAQAVPVHRRRLIHQSCVAQLESSGCDDDARLAFHADEANDSTAVMRYAPAAAYRAAGLNSHREAAAQFERALRHATDRDPSLPDLYEAYADEASLLDRWQDAEQAAERALELWQQQGNPLRVSDAWGRLAWIRTHTCHGRDAIDAAEAAVTTLQSLGPTVELARAHATFAHQSLLHGLHDSAMDQARIATELARSLHASDILCDAGITFATSAATKGLDWQPRMVEALDLAVAHGHHNPAGRAYVNLCALLSDRRKFDDAERYLAQGLVYCADHELTAYVTSLESEQLFLLDRRGRWDQAIALATNLLEKINSPANRLWVLVRLGVLSARRGASDTWRYLDEAITTADRSAESYLVVAARLARAEARWLAGDEDEARLEAELADSLLVTGDAWQRGEIAAWLRRTGSSRPPRDELAEPYRRLLAGDIAGAAQLWQDLSCPYDAALALADGTEESDLRHALSILNQLGATAAGRIVQTRLRALGVRSVPAGPQATTRAHPLGLTRREREILGLIREDRTNAEIAALLVISERTVHHHVSSILTKLGVTSRTRAAEKADAILDEDLPSQRRQAG
ncbi:AAA family ATPase [Kribbella sp. NBC_00662]|uniref:ATP-binding protein n=1 Tax=Kribbella sp. NBC_00662 TaxID=2975969 RepID=UPI0032466294